MSTTITTNRNYTFPLQDEDLESSNLFLKLTTQAIDSDVHTLFTTKADQGTTDTSAEVDTKISTAINDYNNQLDIYGTYVNGDVNTDAIDSNKLILKNVVTAGTHTKITYNAKGLVTGGTNIVKADVTNFVETDYVHIAGTETITGSKTFTGSVALSGTPTAPTAVVGTNTTQIATTAFVIANSSSSGTTKTDYTFTATSNQTTFTISYIDVSSVDVFINGIRLEYISDFTLSSGTTLTLVQPSDLDSYLFIRVWGDGTIYSASPTSGTTALRPSVSNIGVMYFDTTLVKPIWWSGTNWVDSTGATV